MRSKGIANVPQRRRVSAKAALRGSACAAVTSAAGLAGLAGEDPRGDLARAGGEAGFPALFRAGQRRERRLGGEEGAAFKGDSAVGAGHERALGLDEERRGEVAGVAGVHEVGAGRLAVHFPAAGDAELGAVLRRERAGDQLVAAERRAGGIDGDGGEGGVRVLALRGEDAEIDPAVIVLVAGVEEEHLRRVVRGVQGEVDGLRGGALDLHGRGALEEVFLVAFAEAEHHALRGAGWHAEAVGDRAVVAPGDMAELGRDALRRLGPVRHAADAVEALVVRRAAVGGGGGGGSEVEGGEFDRVGAAAKPGAHEGDARAVGEGLRDELERRALGAELDDGEALHVGAGTEVVEEGAALVGHRFVPVAGDAERLVPGRHAVAQVNGAFRGEGGGDGAG
jgi:hypothetical protein